MCCGFVLIYAMPLRRQHGTPTMRRPCDTQYCGAGCASPAPLASRLGPEPRQLMFLPCRTRLNQEHTPSGAGLWH